MKTIHILLSYTVLIVMLVSCKKKEAAQTDTAAIIGNWDLSGVSGTFIPNGSGPDTVRYSYNPNGNVLTRTIINPDSTSSINYTVAENWSFKANDTAYSIVSFKQGWQIIGAGAGVAAYTITGNASAGYYLTINNCINFSMLCSILGVSPQGNAAQFYIQTLNNNQLVIMYTSAPPSNPSSLNYIFSFSK